MADKLLYVNENCSVKASQVTRVTISHDGWTILVHTPDSVHPLAYSHVREVWKAKDSFEKAVNDALAGV